MGELEEFRDFRKEMNEKIFSYKNKQINRFFSLDTQSYRDGAIPSKYKELLGLATSTVLRCEDCITYHMIRAVQERCSDDEIIEALEIALIVGGSITIPELRRAIKTLYILREKEKNNEPISELL